MFKSTRYAKGIAMGGAIRTFISVSVEKLSYPTKAGVALCAGDWVPR